ncbi:DEAD/DEAH box helicase family protein [Lichenihabitans sp. Uapishka_5]|uniref:DEAD/DEAH box helicase n=1 Tax=Lichenihabitans sp. Uapishka_5 TaxID=3037302 RepID=UPI0029E80A2D|nr:DEAD/DEAH box helicase family protein [Lichenihabitans sp. Uapishka_5]MDX7951143.1 DEAD/DEAH box helicase family protein [Lichenihabitans sp. Uapishka_5]
MSYFESNYSALTYPLPSGPVPGFRDAQRGALFALGSHFSQRYDPAIVTMPTGSGKTAVLQAAAFLLRARRALVITPSRLVREQIYEDFRVLGVLKRLGAVPGDLAVPTVFNANGKIADWDALRLNDVIIATPNSASPSVDGVALPPPDFFDLVLVDEAHHSPAHTWTELLKSFPDARRALFSATPFRRDEMEIKGRFVFTYDLKRAYDDGVFGQIRYVPIEGVAPAEEDAAIARAAELQLRSDQADGYLHRLMVRTDSKARAKDLLGIYERETGLKLQLITSEHSLTHVKRAIALLRTGDLDGIICVNMLGEGFDLPSLKIAAIHSPHKSLAVTLQFIGRFARTAGDRLGQATFIAAPSSIKVEAEKLYAQGAAWNEIVPNLSATRVLKEERAREILESFSTDAYNPPDLDELSLYGLMPYMHVKVWRLSDQVSIDETIKFPAAMNVVYTAVSEDFVTAVFITREQARVKWSEDDRLMDLRNHLFVIHHNREHGFLFVCASKRQDGTYQRLAEAIAGHAVRGLSTSTLDRVLLDLDNTKFFNIGMRSRTSNSAAEQYTIKAGGSVERTIDRSHGQQYTRGHFFGRGTKEGVDITIGASSASKVWQNSSARLFDLIEWMDEMADKLASTRKAVTNSGLDLLSMAAEIERLPAKVFFADWDKDVYLKPWSVMIPGTHGFTAVPLSDFDIAVDHDGCTGHEVPITIKGHGLVIDLTFDIRGAPYFRLRNGSHDVQMERHGGVTCGLLDHLEARPPIMLTVAMGHLVGNAYTEPHDLDHAAFDPACILPHDFRALNVCINTEVGQAHGGKRSIFEFVQDHLGHEPGGVIFCDHGAGEIADFISIRENGEETLVDMIHCKSTKERTAGARVADAYEVVGQAIKSVRWCERERIKCRIEHRRQGAAERFIRGTFGDVERMLRRPHPPRFTITIVQPGFAGAALSQELRQLFASAHLHLRSADVEGFRVMTSP